MSLAQPQASWTPAATCVTSPDFGPKFTYGGLDWRGKVVDARSLFALYCNLKPIAACAILRLVDELQLSLDLAVGHLLPGPLSEAVQAVTIWDLLAHRSGLRCFGAIAIRALQPSLRWDFISQLGPDPAGKAAGFADAEPWFILGRVLEHVYGGPYQRALRELVLEPYGVLDAELGDEEMSFDRVAVSGVVDGDFEIAAPSEISPSVASEWNPAFGGYMTSRALHQFAMGVANDRAGAGRVLRGDTMLLATTPQAVAEPDDIFHRSATFGLGFLVNGPNCWLDDRLSPEAFGHVNQGGRGFFLVDPVPERGALVATGLFLDSLNDPTEVVLRRRQLVQGICDELDW